MQKVFVPVLLALALVASTSTEASAFGHLAKLLGHGGCDSGCDTGCYSEPACGCEVAAPTCGCEVVDPCCGAPKLGLLHKLFHKHHGCDSGCDMGCAAPAPCYVEPACGCEVAAPSCGCEAAPCCGPKHKLGGFLKKLFHHKSCGCGCEVIEPACGCEPSCGFEAAPSCGCGG